MHLKTIGAVSALALFAGVSAGAFAQAPGAGPSQGVQERMQTPGQSSREMAPGQQQMTPGQQRGPSQAQEPGRRQGPQAQEPGLRKGQQAQEPSQRKGRQAQEPGQKKGMQAEDTETRRQKQRAEQPEGKQQRQRAQQPEGKQPQRAEEPTRGKAQQQAGREGRRLSEQQRTTVRERIRESGALERARVSSVDFNISVGTRVPRDRVRLAPLPTVIVEEVPAYRGHLYFVVRDELVIVNPQTYAIVDVIRVDGAAGRTATRGQTQTRLSLSPQQRQFVLSHVEMQPSVRLGIGDISIGMDLPRQVELRTFPAAVIQEVPELRSYRYIVFEDEVAIVDPQQRRVVLTISE